MPPKRSIGSAGSRGMSSRTGSSRGRSSRQEPRTAKRPRQQASDIFF
ncbi:unnamed protein product [Ectocarpus fasciculatus]